MAKPYRLKEVENQRGDLHEVIPPLVNSGGQKRAAEDLGVSQSAISQWLTSNGYVCVRIWTRDVTELEGVA